ncbi:hypothetical protein Tco_1110519 [Tanacetum coccineum]|uniref:Uncharacterized protein n=1 Tax=Tanacetum coccineum TaxID=301880 RepID=A0ABQ5IJG6_9ASTR
MLCFTDREQVREGSTVNGASGLRWKSIHVTILTWLERFKQAKSPVLFEKAHVEPTSRAKGGDDGFTLSWANFKELFLPPIFPLRAEQDAPKSREYHSLRQRAGGEQSERPRLSLGSSQVESPGPFSYAWSFTDDAQGLVVVYYVNNNEQQSLRDNKQGNSGGWTANHRNRGQHVPPSYQLGSSKTRRLSRVLYFPVAPHCDVDTQVSVVVLRVLVLVAVQAGLSSERLQRTRVLLVRLVMLTRSLDAIRPRLCADSGPRLLTDYWYITGNCFRVQDRISRRTSRNSTIRDVEFNIEAYSGAEPISKLLSHASDELKELKDQFAMELCGARFYPSQVLSPWEALHHVVLFGQEKVRIFRPFSKDIPSIHDSFPQNCYASPFLYSASNHSRFSLNFTPGGFNALSREFPSATSLNDHCRAEAYDFNSAIRISMTFNFPLLQELSNNKMPSTLGIFGSSPIGRPVAETLGFMPRASGDKGEENLIELSLFERQDLRLRKSDSAYVVPENANPKGLGKRRNIDASSEVVPTLSQLDDEARDAIL